MGKFKLIGFEGKMGSGKSTAIDQLKEVTDYGVMNVKFAQPLYDIQEFIYDRIKQVYTRPDNFIKDRKLLQWIGTEFGRESIRDTLWVDLWREHVRKLHFDFPKVLIVCDDVRFDNEAEVIKGLGGHVIRITTDKTDTRTVAKDGIMAHKSEAGIDNRFVDAIIENNGTIEDLKDSLLTLNGTLGIW